ncbi:flocculation protein flo11-like isoform x1 [Plakobranchus ocellatus]|uniref:Flocculation protein flo11-like isoform x1 n=1 Tax=Plakobranchus ocellatus TaxID=259542 RepID=A0AAV3ZC91_9GAST|nr:flocculation protein flo11-like isoform x1 [Plakobranchus ocellatus]
MSQPKKKPVEVVVFNNPWKGKDKSSNSVSEETKQKSSIDTRKPGSSTDRPVFDQKKAKYEIRKLGIHGMDKANKQNAMVDLLVELGAKPPRNKFIRIKDYQQQKANKEKEEEEETPDLMDGKKKKKPKEKRKRDKDDLLNYVDGQPGFYKHGVQFVKKLKR